MADGEVIDARDLRLPNAPQATLAQAPAAIAPPPIATGMIGAPPVTAAAAAAADPRAVNPRDTGTNALPSFIEEIERNAIQQALQEHRYNKTKTAAALGITFRALRYKLKKLGIE
jgi:two-component system response regulator PilR (NtrC family)